ncbi:MAG: TolC family protein, partial [Bacteroidaceae bacterium]
MIKIKRLTVITALLLEFGGVSSLLQAQNIQTKNSAVISNDSSLVHSKLPAEWNLQNCIDYALQNNIQIRKDRITAASSEVDLKKAKAALFPDLTFSTSHDLVNRPYQESSSYVSGSEVLSSTSKTTYSGSFGLNASYTLFNGGKRSKTIKQNYLDKQISDLGVNESENEIKESITKIYVQILYAAESVTINSSTLKVSQAEYNRGEELFKAGSLAKADVAQLKSE